MVRLAKFKVRFQPEGREVIVTQGTPLLRAAAEAGLRLDIPCAGAGTCGKCRVRVVAGARDPNQQERTQIAEADLVNGVRLGCQVSIDRDLVIELEQSGAGLTDQIMIGGIAHRGAVQSDAKWLEVSLEKAPLGDDRADWRRLEDAVGARLEPTLPALRALPLALGEETSDLSVAISAGRVTTIRRGLPTAPARGLAVDIGTTTVVVYLVDLVTGAEVAHSAALNPQVRFGDDVVSRIHHATTNPGGLEELRDLIATTISDLAAQVCDEAGMSPADILRVTAVGNATMAHLLLGIHPKGLGLAPFAPVNQRSVTATGLELGLPGLEEAVVTVLPNIAGFLGSDTVAAMIATNPDPAAATLVVDIGTNGEMVLFANGRWSGCSAAAGPAFEGARISCGMRGASGAIAAVELDGDNLRMTTIGGEQPRGLCGSGLLDAVAVLLQAGLLDASGRLQAPSPGLEQLAGRVSGEGREAAFRLVEASASATGRELRLTARDIREVQLAKGSIRASIEALLARADLQADDLDAVYLAGGFGSYLRVASALQVGLLPPIGADRITAVGNAAGAGARLSLLSSDELAGAERLATEVEVVDLATDPVYHMQLMDQMMFPDQEVV